MILPGSQGNLFSSPTSTQALVIKRKWELHGHWVVLYLMPAMPKAKCKRSLHFTHAGSKICADKHRLHV